MPKSKGFTEEDLKRRGLVEIEKGVFAPTAKSNVGSNVHDVEMIVKAKVNDSPDFQVAPVTEWFIPYQTPSKKNSRITFTNKATGRVVNIPSKAYTEYKNLTKMYWTTFGKEFKQTIATLGLQYPLNIEMTFIRKTNQLVDYFGPGESVFDLMTDFGWWEDDNRRFGKPFFGDMQVDKNRAGVIIKILL
nr:hypothetical protein [uncultured Flavobacterium sp.]